MGITDRFGWRTAAEGGAVFTLFFPLSSVLESGARRPIIGSDRMGEPDTKRRGASELTMATILIIEDEAKMRRLLELNLGEDGFKTLSAGDAETGSEAAGVGAGAPCADRSQTSGHERAGISANREAAKCRLLPIVVMTAFGSVETAVEAMKAGASDYVLKPFSLAEMRMVVHKELDHSRLREENRSLREALGQKYSHPNIVARSPKMQEVLATVERVAPTNSTVLAWWRERRRQRFDCACYP